MLAGPALGVSAGSAAVTSHANPSSAAGPAPNLVFAGYIVNLTASRMAITTTVVAPKLKCTHAGPAVAAGVTMFAPAKKSAAELFVGCLKGKPSYFPVLVVNGKRRSYRALAVGQGDKVVLTVADGPSGDRVTVMDEAHKAIRKSVTGRGSAKLSGPCVGDFAWTNGSRTERVPDFGTLGYSASKLDGKGLASYGKELQRYNRVSTAGTIQIATSGFVHTRESFKTFFRHA